jgi:hypothetical protein
MAYLLDRTHGRRKVRAKVQRSSSVSQTIGERASTLLQRSADDEVWCDVSARTDQVPTCRLLVTHRLSKPDSGENPRLSLLSVINPSSVFSGHI